MQGRSVEARPADLAHGESVIDTEGGPQCRAAAPYSGLDEGSRPRGAAQLTPHSRAAPTEIPD